MVVSNSTPLIAFARIGELELLRRIVGRVVIPTAVWDETTGATNRAGADEVQRAAWIEVRKPTSMGGDRNAYELVAGVVFDQDREPFQNALGQLEQERAVRRTFAALVLAQRQLRQVSIEPTLDIAFLDAHDAVGRNAHVELGALKETRAIPVVNSNVRLHAVEVDGIVAVTF